MNWAGKDRSFKDTPSEADLVQRKARLEAGQVDRLHRGMRGKTECACQRTNARSDGGFQLGRQKFANCLKIRST
jgi:hypothetical protein